MESTPHTSGAGRAAFFRQSGWMMIAGVAAGACMFGVHFFSKRIPEAEYGVLGTLLAMLNCITIPTLGLQMVFAQQTAAALTDEQQRQLAATTRAVLLASFCLWLAAAVVVLLYQTSILARLKILNPAAIWVTLLVGLGSLWKPIFSGLLQGQQKFLWLGGASIVEGIGRLSFVALIVLLFHGHATGIMTGALLAIAATLVVLVWNSREIWLGPGTTFAWRVWLGRVIPLTLGFGASQFMFSADPIFVQSYFDREVTHPYMAAGTLSRALVFFTAPLVAVMFPKIVRSTARAEKTDVMALALMATGILALLAALFLSLIAPWMLRFVFKETFLSAVPLLPWFACAMVPLTLANVLINSLLARGRFAVVPWLLVVALAYGITLTFLHDSFFTVIRVLGTFNLLLLGVGAWFTWKRQ